jgi:hypothetical protein
VVAIALVRQWSCRRLHALSRLSSLRNLGRHASTARPDDLRDPRNRPAPGRSACVRWRARPCLDVGSWGLHRRLRPVQQQFFPLSERPELFLQLRLPEGTAIGVTQAAVEEAER